MPNWNIFNFTHRDNVPTYSQREVERQQRLDQYRLVWEAYLAELPDALVTDKGGVNDNVKINPSRAIIDTGVYFLFGREVHFHVNAEESPDSSDDKPVKGKTGKTPFKPGDKPQGKFEGREGGSEEKKGSFDKPKDPESKDPNKDPAEAKSKGFQPHYDPEADAEAQDVTETNPEDVGSEGGYQDTAYVGAQQTHETLSSEGGGSSKPKPEEAKKPFEQEKPKQEEKPPVKTPGFGPDLPQYEPPKIPEGPKDPVWMKKLNKAWKANQKRKFLVNLGKSGALHGDIFVKFVPNAAGLNNQYPRLILLNPADVDVITNPNDIEHVIQFTIDYMTEEIDEDGAIRVVRHVQKIVQAEDMQSWEIRDFEQRGSMSINDRWIPESDQEDQIGPTQVWPYSWPPIEHCQNLPLPHMFWGQPDLDESSIEVLQSLQRSMSNLNKIVRLHSSPRLFAKNVMPDMLSEIDISPENIIALPQMDADLQVLQVLDNLSSALEFTKQVKSDLLEMVRVPAIALGHAEDIQAASASGINMSILYSPIIQKTEEKQITYGDMLVRICQKMLVLMGVEVDEEMEDLVVDWPECMPGSKYLERQTLQQDSQMGVSQHTIVKKLGYNPDEEDQRNQSQQQQQTSMQAGYGMQVDGARMEQQNKFAQQKAGPGGNNNPAGMGNKSGSTGAFGNSTPKGSNQK